MLWGKPVYGEILKGKGVAVLSGLSHSCVKAPQNGVGSCFQFPQAVRFYNIIVRASDKSLDFVVFRAFSSKKNNRGGSEFSDFSAQLESIHLRHHDI